MMMSVQPTPNRAARSEEVKSFREMLTLGRIQGMYNKNKFANLSEQELRVLRGWLYARSHELRVMVREVCRKLEDGVG